MRTILEPGVSHTFHTSISNQLVRTGVLPDGSCFFHSVLYSILPTYRKLSRKEKTNIVTKIRDDIVNTLTIEEWKSIGDGEMFRLHFVMSLRDKLHKFSSNPEKFSKFSPNHSFEYWDDSVMSALSNEWNSIDTNDAYDIILNNIENANQEVIDIKKLCLMIETKNFENYKCHLETQWADEFFMELATRYFKCNIFFIDTSPETNVYRMYDKGDVYDKNILICWIDETHYESIGVRDEHNCVRRIFDNNDPLIQRLRSINKD